ncbi:acyl-CoA N-acyltransferase [Calocera cornea HHB12733]|uniref:Acyl-CoA N-acyltransferase n=1 Tax=Calocera cornea HHB12733 TaxID=1353952 RepID=A0A165J5X5_9BASI|nr:acyl-CoA N-acyltransferase [Calocera cornea HHB12733]
MPPITLTNSYAPPRPAEPSDEELLHPPGGVYDVNFCFPVPPELESEKVRLVPFVPSVHMPLFQEKTAQHPSLFKYVSFGPLLALPDALQMYERMIRSDPTATWFAVLDKTRADSSAADAGLGLGGAFAGDIGILSASPGQSQAEIGYIMYLPESQRTHVNTHAVGLLLHYLLDAPAQGGLGLRRVQWKANAENAASVRAALRLGFRSEGTLRWHMVLPEGKEGAEAREDGDGVRGPGRHSAMLSLCWDDWVGGGRERVDMLMARD